MPSSLRFDIDHRPDFALLRVHLQPHQTVFAEPSAMATMDPGIQLKAGFRGGLLQSMGRAFGGESMIVNTFRAGPAGGEVSFAPATMGDVVHHTLDGASELLLQRGAYVASSEGVEVTGSWQGARGFFSGEGMVLLKARGQGDLFFGTYGGLVEMDVREGLIVDSGYIVAFESTLDYRIGVLPGLRLSAKIKSFIFGGEALVCQFSGQGKVWVQTRAVQPFLRWLHPFRPEQR